MKCRVTAMLAILMLTLPIAASGANRTRGIVTVWTGTYIQDDPGRNVTGKCPATGCVGDLVTCAPSETITMTKQKFSFVARVCDDTTDQVAPCAEQLTGLIEECTGPGDRLDLGPLTAVNAHGAARYCAGSGDCTGAEPSRVVGNGTTLTQVRSPARSSTASGITTIRGKYRRFTYGGFRVLFYIAHTYYNTFTLEPNDGSNCGGGGCGVAGVGVTDRR